MRLAFRAAGPAVLPHEPTALPRHHEPRPGGLPVVRWALLTILLLAEVVGLTVAFDAGVRTADAGWAGTIIFRSPYLLRAGVVALLVIGVLGLWRLRDEIRLAARAGSDWAAALWALAQVGAFALFVLATGRVLGDSTRSSAVEPLDLLTWLATGAMTVGLWAAAMVPPAGWPRLVRRGRGILLAGVVVAVVALPAALLFQSEWDDLSRPTLWVSSHLVQLFASDAVCDPETRTLGTTAFRVTVAPHCSGYEGMGLIAAYLGAYLWVFRRDLRFPRALLLLPLGIAAVWVANAVRIAALVLIGDRVSPQLALGGFHSQAGWIGFSAVALGLVGVSHRSRLFTRGKPVDRPEPSPTVAYLAPLLAVVLVEILAVAFLPDPDLAYPVRAGAAGALLLYFWPRYESLRVAGRDGLAPALFAGVGVYVLWETLVRFGLAGGSSAETWPVPDELPRWALGPWLAVWGIGFTIVTPVVEELAFRGYLMRRLVARDFQAVPVGRFTWVSFLGSSVLFGLLHGEWVAGTLAGMAYALVAVRTGRVRDAVIAHALTNALLWVSAMVGGP
jgi:exosortase E/protease (VPEID-CTERM system)